VADAQQATEAFARIATIGQKLGIAADRLQDFVSVAQRHQKKQHRGLLYGYRRLRALRHGLAKCKRRKRLSFALFT
jgi:tRNA 2-selenouridine synthase SelU